MTGSITIQLSRSLITGDFAPASAAISSSVSGSSPRASRQSKVNSASGPNRPSISWPSRGADATSTRACGTSSPRSPRGQNTSTPTPSSASRPCSSRSASSSASSTIRSGTCIRCSRSSGDHAFVAVRSALPRLSRALAEKPWPSAPPWPSQSWSASTKWVSSSTSWAWSTTTTPPPSSTSPGASIRSARRTWSGRSGSSSSVESTRVRRTNVVVSCSSGGRVIVSATASSSCRMTSSASSTSVSAWARAVARARRRSSSSGCSGPTRQESPVSESRTRPAATSFIASNVAPLSRPTDGWASSTRIARVSTGMAPRIGIRIVRAGPENSTSLSRGGCWGTQVARPCRGTKLTGRT